MGYRGRKRSVEVHFTLEQEAQIIKAGEANHTDAEKLVMDATLRFVDNFRAAVIDAKAYADRGEFIEEDDMNEV